jgi:hypothetical protein
LCPQEQRAHIQILDTALSNAQATISRLEEDNRLKEGYAERVKQMTKSLEQLQAGEDKFHLFDETGSPSHICMIISYNACAVKVSRTSNLKMSSASIYSFFYKNKKLPPYIYVPWRDSITRPIATVSSVEDPGNHPWKSIQRYFKNSPWSAP